MPINDKGNGRLEEARAGRSVVPDNDVADFVLASKETGNNPVQDSVPQQRSPRLSPRMVNGRAGSNRGSMATMSSYPPRRFNRAPTDAESVVREPIDAGMSPMGDFIFTYATFADEVPPWGTRVAGRDRELRRFWPTEPVLTSALFSISAKYAAMEWILEGPARTVGLYQKMLESVQYGEGWTSMWMRSLTDLFTQDNGGFTEVVRMEDSPASPVISLNHLDANRCIRTGWRDQPVIYYDSYNTGHLLKWYQVIPWSEFPSPIESMRGIQYSALTRMLRAAQIMRDISVYKREKLSGRFNKSIYLVSGIQQAYIESMVRQQGNIANSEGITRYLNPLIIGSLDPSANVHAEKIDLASLPDGYDENETMRWYVNQLALAFGGDYQDFSPLPGGNLGTSQQSQTLHLKSRSKGALLFRKLLQQKFNYWGLLPPTVTLKFTEQDQAQEAAVAELGVTRAKKRAQMIMSGEINTEVSRLIAVDDGDLDTKYLLYLNDKPIDTDVTINQDDPAAASPELGDIDNPAKYEGEGPDGPLLPSGAPGTADTQNQGASSGNQTGQGTGNRRSGTNGSSPVPSTNQGQTSTPNGRSDSGGGAVRKLLGRKPPA